MQPDPNQSQTQALSNGAAPTPNPVPAAPTPVPVSPGSNGPGFASVDNTVAPTSSVPPSAPPAASQAPTAGSGAAKAVESVVEGIVAAEAMTGRPGIGVGGYGPGYYDPAYGRYGRSFIRLGRVGSFIACLIFGLIFAGAGYLVYRTSIIPASYVRTSGTVTSMNTIYGSHGYSYSPNIQFTVNGQPYNFTDSIASNPPDFTVGQTVTVAYDPASPNNAKNASDKGGTLIGVVFIVLGAILVLVGPLNLLRKPKPANQVPLPNPVQS